MAGSAESLDGNMADWLEANFPDAAPKLLVKHPWAKTWRFQHDGQTYFLKQIKGEGPRKVQAAANISSVFGTVVPAVKAYDPDLSLMAVEDHGGTELKSRTKNMKVVLLSYAGLQVQAIEDNFVPNYLPHLDVQTIFADFLNFLSAGRVDADTKKVGAQYFFGARDAARLSRLYSDITDIVQPFVCLAKDLPQSINHCDLRPPNMAARNDKSITIFDWDDAVWGPIGLSLHSQFSGCLRPFRALIAKQSDLTSSTVKSDRKHLEAYLAVFEKAGIIDSGAKRKALAASIFAGTINYIVEFRHYHGCGDKMKKTIRSNIEKRANSLLDVAERLVKGNPEQSRKLAIAYLSAGEEARFEKLNESGKKPLINMPDLNGSALENSRKSGVFPTVKFSDLERDSGICTRDNARLAAKIYKEQGVVMLENALKRSMLKDCHSHILSSYQDYFQDKRPADSLRVGNKRFMITLKVEGPINQPAFYAPPTVMPILKRLLSDKLILGSLVAVVSLPGAKNQSRHRDHHALFPEGDYLPPPFATSVMIPLIHMDKEVGATRLFKGSHSQPTKIASKMPGQDPVVPVGSCFLMDYRVQHMGMANISKDKVRPVLTLIFQRPWFRDYVNYDNQERLIIPEGEVEKIPDEHRPLFDWK